MDQVQNLILNLLDNNKVENTFCNLVLVNVSDCMEIAFPTEILSAKFSVDATNPFKCFPYCNFINKDIQAICCVNGLKGLDRSVWLGYEA